MIPGFAILIDFLAAQTADLASAHWPKGPTVGYRGTGAVPIADYIAWVREVESSPALAGESRKELIQRMRRLSYSDPFTVRWKKATSESADNMMCEVIPGGEPPLTTDHVSLTTLNGLFGMKNVRTARGLDTDIGHLWMLADWVVNGGSIFAAGYFDSEPEAVLSWGGDLGSAIAAFWNNVDWVEKETGGSMPTADKQRIMLVHLNELLGKDDLLGDLDAVVLSERWRNLGSFVVSRELEQYYRDDAMPQAQAVALTYPSSARRFHYYVKAATPTIPASGLDSSPLDVTLKKLEAIDKMKQDLVALASDVWTGWMHAQSISQVNVKLDTMGRAEFEKLCTHFVVYLKLGLRDGDAPWPPASL